MPERESNLFATRRTFVAGIGSTAASLLLAGCAPHASSAPRGSGYHAPALHVGGDRSLKAQAAQHHLLTGFALSMQELRDSEAYRRTVREQSSIAVAENAMKWAALRPSPGQFHFEDADELLRFCETEHIKLRGHNLCWHESLPPWFETTVNASNARSVLTEHIRVVAGRYAGRLHSWDVVNEAIEVKDGRPDGLRNSPWLKLVGENYIEVAFRAAREADPAALLTYNEYGIEGESQADAAKRAATLLLLRRLKQRHVPIDAVGIQSHIRAHEMPAYGASLRSFIQSCREMDLEVFITELDVDDRSLPTQPEMRDAGVAETYRKYLELVLAEPNVRAVLMWGVDDGHTWLTRTKARQDGKPQRPLLFDGTLRAKPALAAVTQSFAEARPLPTLHPVTAPRLR